MRVLPFICIFSLLFLSSCQQNVPLEIDKDKKQIIFISDEANQAELQKEAPYYDAIIELRKKFPEEFKEMITITPNIAKEYDDTFEVKNRPALLVIYNQSIIGIVDGESSKEEIIETMVTALNE